MVGQPKQRRRELDIRLEQVKTEVAEFHSKQKSRILREMHIAWMKWIVAEKSPIEQLVRRGLISQWTAAKMSENPD